ncbi:hypothetical protein Bomanpvs2gp132 [Bombyx mandarina nucleopolyhedrovirus S2]|uniref:Protein AC150 n=2 Tax=Autographa californica nuclear polyhedrosis virus TaxID=46015 RepID=AC150_NPVAC|nr:AcOrf-150 peptide [Autographa californica nucleopolyhedrovirus]P41707.1 RecName: Full=Protein AC150 [Autographa californica nucleopolyhedrovirus]AFO10102.1 hypothetical protein Bomanpvs2gp132 [Bombyx mandarina nucleopolyhedrovirus S2]AKN59000.1 AcOrf-150 peptide [Autographa californica multiple nucleopolyhedrovirus]ARJ58682.1 Orf-150 protein [synthetic baculovirus AcMNPV-WIV-Syn1]UVY87262.1 Acorf150 protein [synthetic construct]AAA66780.1 AcOrf-150 peptide [Autographa californica nucleopol
MLKPNMLIIIFIIVCLFSIIIFTVLKSKRGDDDESDDGFSCYNKPIGVNFPHPTRCDAFYMCVGLNQKLELICPEGFEFDPDVKNCVPISDYGCTANQN